MEEEEEEAEQDVRERPRLAKVSSLLDARSASRVQNDGAKWTVVGRKCSRNGHGVSKKV